MTRPYTPLPWCVSKDGRRIIGKRNGRTITVASGFFARDARCLVTAANLHLRLTSLMLRIRPLLVRLTEDDINVMRRELVEIFNTLFVHTEGDHS